RAEAERQSLIEDGVLPGIRRDHILGRAFLRQTNLIDPPGTLFHDPEVLARAKYRRDKNQVQAADHPAITRQRIIDLIEAARPWARDCRRANLYGRSGTRDGARRGSSGQYPLAVWRK